MRVMLSRHSLTPGHRTLNGANTGREATPLANHANLRTPDFAPHFQSRISGMSWPCRLMY